MTKKCKFRSWSTYDHKLVPGEKNSLPSKTVPDQSLSLKTILERYVRGQDVAVFNPVYSESEMIPDNLERLDTVDRLDLMNQIGDSIRAIQRKKRPSPDPAPPAPDPAPPAPDPAPPAPDPAPTE